MSFRSIHNREFTYKSIRKTGLNLDVLIPDFRNTNKDVKCIRPEYDLAVEDIVPLSCKFALHDPDILAITYEDGTLAIHNTSIVGDKSLNLVAKYFQNAIFDLAWIPNEPTHLLTATAVPGINCFDLTRGVDAQKTPEGCNMFKGHSGTVKSLSHRPDDKFVFISGSRDGTIMIWDRRKNNKSNNEINPVNILWEPHGQKTNTKSRSKKLKLHPASDRATIACVQFQDEFTFFSAGTRDQDIKVWDLRFLNSKKLTPKAIFNHGASTIKKGYSYITFDKTMSRLYANCMNNNVYEFDCNGLVRTPINTYTGHRNESFYIRSSVSPDNRYLISGSSDGKAHIWSLNRGTSTDSFRPKFKLCSHENELSVALWSPSRFDRIVTLSDDNRAQFWRCNRDKVIRTPLGGINIFGTVTTCELSPIMKQKNKDYYRSYETDINGDNIYKKKLQLPYVECSIFGTNSERNEISPTGFSPLKSPRKVTVTPLKRCPAPLSLVFTPSSSVKVVSISSASTSATAITSNKKSVKRNLYGELTDDVKDAREKRVKLEPGFISPPLTPVKQELPEQPAGILTPTKNYGGGNVTPSNPSTPTSRRLKTSSKCTSRFRSPTSNLPDSIKDEPMPSYSVKATTSVVPEETTPKGRDWLTKQILSAGRNENITNFNSPGITPKKLHKTNNQLTPKVRKSTPRRRLQTTNDKLGGTTNIRKESPISIKKFFSPIQKK